MFQQTSRPTFDIDLYQPFPRIEDMQVTPLRLRDLWVNHLRNKQDQFDIEDASRRPLTQEFKARNFFGH